MSLPSKLSMLLATTGLCGGLWAAPALAQDATAGAGGSNNAVQTAQDAGASLLADVVVTATRQVDTVSRVPLSISAVTQRSLDIQGVQTINDLQRITPGIGILPGNTVGGANSVSGDTNISIRGIASNGSASPTTGIYLDDVALQKRGNMASGSNSPPIPKLFDLDRVEVLRGPQGTLYGGSAEGGAVRFITPQPSLTRYSGQAKAEISQLHDGGTSYEVGVAAGGPLVPDKLGFRASVFSRHGAGYVDHVSIFTGKTTAEDTNYERSTVLRAAMTWAPIERLQITPSVWFQIVKRGDNDFFMENLTTPYTVPAFSSNAAGKACTPAPGAPCAFTVPAHTYGPYLNYGPYKNPAEFYDPRTGAERASTSPSKQRVFLPVLTAVYDFGPITARAISSYIRDKSVGYNDSTYTGSLSQQVDGYPVAFPIISAAPDKFNVRRYVDDHEGVQEELRLSSNPNTGPLSWVAGVYYSWSRVAIPISSVVNLNYIPEIHGVPYTVYYGLPLITTGPGTKDFPGFGFTETFIRVASKDSEVAGYGEANYQVTTKLKATVGVRYSHNNLDYESINYGTSRGYLVPTLANGGFTKGMQKDSTVTPKFGLSYQATDRDLVYATVSKGYRPGGVNITPVLSRCAAEFAADGLPPTGPDQQFAADSTWSYEGGAKLRLFGGKAQVNSSAYYIDWKNIQSTISLGSTCGFNYQTNAGKAVSKGFDIQGQGRIGPFTLSVAVGYTNAKYTQPLYSPINATTGTRTLFIADGDRIPFVPDWQYSLGLQYDTELMGYNAFLRGDYQYIGNQVRGFGPGTATFAADVFKFKPVDTASFRAGVSKGQVELSAYLNNAFNSQDRTYHVGGSTNAGRIVNPLFFSSTLRPREFGADLHYRF